MKSFKAITLMVIWTAVTGYGLYVIGVYQEVVYRDPLNAIGIGVALLVIHLVNLAIYFTVAGEEPYKWIKD